MQHQWVVSSIRISPPRPPLFHSSPSPHVPHSVLLIPLIKVKLVNIEHQLAFNKIRGGCFGAITILSSPRVHLWTLLQTVGTMEFLVKSCVTRMYFSNYFPAVCLEDTATDVKHFNYKPFISSDTISHLNSLNKSASFWKRLPSFESSLGHRLADSYPWLSLNWS